MLGSEYFGLLVYLGLVVLVVVLTLAVTGIVMPSKRAPGAKYAPYESGIETTTELLQERFKLRHYLVGLIFLVFDVEVIFLFPWAVVAKELGPFAFYEIAFFLGALVVGFLYIWRKGGLEWQ